MVKSKTFSRFRSPFPMVGEEKYFDLPAEVESAKRIEVLISRLQAILENSLRTNSRIGYFVVLYLQVCRRIQSAVAEGDVFDDHSRMARFSEIFFHRFVSAWDAWDDRSNNGDSPTDWLTSSWRHTFSQLQDRHVLVATHLSLGMNSHITYDLGIAAAQVTAERGEPLSALRADFNTLNHILAPLATSVVLKLRELSPSYAAFETSMPLLVPAVRVYLHALRVTAWHFAAMLERYHGSHRVLTTRAVRTVLLAQLMLRPPIGRALMARIAEEESARPVASNINILKRIELENCNPISSKRPSCVRMPQRMFAVCYDFFLRSFGKVSVRGGMNVNSRINICPLCGRQLLEGSSVTHY